MAERRFPPPWSVENIGAAFVVKDNAGQNLAQPVLLLLLFWMLLFWLPTKSIDVILKSLNFAYRRL
jgi:hypothetical protein